MRPCFAAASAQQKLQKDLVIDSNRAVKVKDPCAHNAQREISDALALSQVLTRRSLALDLVGIATFNEAEAWTRKLLRGLQQTAPPGHSR